MANFVMIHGSWHGGWCFDRLRAPIEAAGHALIAPDLPGMGGNAATLAAVTLDGWAKFAADLCNAMSSPVFLCGHSRGGLVISRAAELAPEAIDALVYICAMMLPPGMSRAEFKPMQQANPEFDAAIRLVEGGSTIDPAAAPGLFAQRAPGTLDVRRLVAEPHAPRSTPLTLSAHRYGSVPRHYVECVQDRTIPLIDQRLMQVMQPCLSVTTLDADHSPYLSAPSELAAALIALVDRQTARAAIRAAL
jgi:pimeloyl-ACP methyl ester carboxylesterase